MKIILTGASGLIGGALAGTLEREGHELVRLVRRDAPAPGRVVAGDDLADLAPAALAGGEAIIHLAGTSIAGARWTPQLKDRIRQSRILGTRRLVDALRALPRPPKVLLCASAVGYYGFRSEAPRDETAPMGEGFLAGVVGDWEREAAAAAEAGLRVVLLRFGVVLDRSGGLLARLLLPFRLGLGGRLGRGTQYLSWIALPDVIGIVRYLLENEAVAGPVNVTAPAPATNRDFTRALARALHRPAFMPVPAFALRLAFGEMADELMLGGVQAVPRKLLDGGYAFRYPDLPAALAASLEY